MIHIFTTAAIVIGVLLDLIIGDPEGWPHPVRLMGRLIESLEAFVLAHIADNPAEKKRAGGLIWLVVVAISGIVPALILWVAWRISPHLYLVAASIMCYQIMATKSLRDESMMVSKMLESDDIYLARIRLGRIVGRDTEDLDAEHIVRATVETVAENCADGCIAPLLYMAVFGPVGGFVYKAVNTMDSMMGYKNEKYIDLGFFPAKADDLFGFIPARLAALFMIPACAITGHDAKRAWKVFLRDRNLPDSPNSGQCESVMAGALGIELLGAASYFGKKVMKPALGDATRKAETGDIEKADDILYVTVVAGVVFTLAGRLIWAKCMGLF